MLNSAFCVQIWEDLEIDTFRTITQRCWTVDIDQLFFAYFFLLLYHDFFYLIPSVKCTWPNKKKVDQTRQAV